MVIGSPPDYDERANYNYTDSYYTEN